MTGQPQTLKRINETLVKDALRAKGVATRRELAEATDLSQPTVNAIIIKLRRENEVVQHGAAISSGGRRAELYCLNSESLCVAAVYVQREGIEYAVTDSCGAILTSGHAAVVAGRAFLEQLCTLANRLIAGYPRVRAVGIGIQSAVNTGVLFAAPQFPDLENCDLQQVVGEACGLPVTVENDVNMRALGYYRQELAQQTDSMAYLHLSTGLGAGFIINKQIHRGFSRFAGEISYLFTSINSKTLMQGSLETTLTQTTDRNTRIDLLEQLAAAIVSIVNPAYFVMGGSRIDQKTVEEVYRYCVKYFPKGVSPNMFYVEDEMRYLLSGIAYSAMECIDTELHLVQQRSK